MRRNATRGYLEAAPIGECHPRAASTPRDHTAFVAPIDTEAGPIVKTAKQPKRGGSKEQQQWPSSEVNLYLHVALWALSGSIALHLEQITYCSTNC